MNEVRSEQFLAGEASISDIGFLEIDLLSFDDVLSTLVGEAERRRRKLR